MRTLSWSEGPDYPFGDYISDYSTAQTNNAAYIIGGFNAMNIIAEFKDGQWRKFHNDLWKGRSSHGSITVGSQTMIVGGYVYDGE